jgi:hypothetical protein
VGKVLRRSGRVLVFVLLTIVPIGLAAAGTVLGIAATRDPAAAPALQLWAVMCAIALGLLLVVKAIRDYRRGITLQRARYNTLLELHDRIGPALDQMTELALLDRADMQSRRLLLRTIATTCCSALVSMTPSIKDVRAVVFELQQPSDVAPLAHFGRNDSPRTFSLSTPAGEEIYAYLKNGRASRGELYRNTKKNAPAHYSGDAARYQTFIRTPIRGNGVVFGMLTVDALKAGSLNNGDVRLAELIAAEVATAFAIAAG